MLAPRLYRAVLLLYPPGFRRRFGSEWLELIEWRARRYQGRSFEALRMGGVVFRDAVRTLPALYVDLALAAMTRIGRRVRAWMGPSGSGGDHPSPSPGNPRPPVVEPLASDLRYAFRGLCRNPLFTAAAVLSLGLGVGANTAIFSVVNAVLLRPLPYENPERLAMVWNEFAAGLSRLPLSPVELVGLREADDVFAGVGGIWASTGTLFRNDEPTHISLGQVTPNFLSLLGVAPTLGRHFLESESGLGPGQGVILSDEFWRQEYGADPDILGSTIRLESVENVVIGVLPPGFKLMLPADGGVPERLDVFTPVPWPLVEYPPDLHFLRIVARLHPGVEWSQGQATVSATAQRMRDTYAELAASGDEFTLVPLHADSVRGLPPVLYALLGVVGLFLLLASANVASLLLARTSGRTREFAIRTCLGASRSRVARQLLVESSLLTVVGGLAGLVLGWWGVRGLWALRPAGLTRVDVVGLDPIVFWFTLGTAVVAGVIFGFAPLLQMSQLHPAGQLRDTSPLTPRGRRLRMVVTAGEVAIALVLFIGAGLLAQTFMRLHRTDVGFDPDRLLSFTVSLSPSRFPDDAERGELARQIEEDLAALPGVVAVGGGSHLPFASWANWSQSAPPDGTPDHERESYHFDHRAVTTTYLQTIGARLRAGRFFEVQDDLTRQPVVIVDAVLAERAFPGQDPIGKRLHAVRYVGGSFVPDWAVVVGVIEGIRDRSPARPSGGQVYWPYAQSPRWELTYAIRTEGDPAAMSDAVRALVTGIRADLSPSNFRVMDDYLAISTADTRFTTILSAIFSGLALVLAALGLYSVVSYSTALRSREIGLRMALGAGTSDIVRRVLFEGMQLGAWGIGAGLGGAFLLTRFMATLLYGVSATDPVTYGVIALFFLTVICVASYVPARRATRVDPIASLRTE